MRSRGKVIYLETPIEIQLSRTLNDKTRPLIENVDKKEVFSALSKERTPIYEELSDIKVPFKDRSKDELLNTVLKLLEI